MIRLAAAALLVLVPWSAAWAKSLSSPPPSVTSPAAKSLADSSVMPLDAVLVLIEGEPITSAQVLARLRLLQGIAQQAPPDPARPLTLAQAHKELVEARLLSWDAARKDITVSEAEVDRLLDALAKKLATSGSPQALADMLTAYGIAVSDYRELCRQEILFTKLDRFGEPALPRKERLRALEAEAQILSLGELLRMAPAEPRVCTPLAPTQVARDAQAVPPSAARVAAVCVEGEPGPASDARLSQLAALVRPGDALDRAAVSRALSALLQGEWAVEAAAAYALSTQPGQPPDRAKSLRVVFRLREHPRLIGMETSGLPAGVELSTGQPGTRVTQRELRELINDAQQTLYSAGFRSARVTVERVAAAPAAAGSPRSGERVRLLVTSGPRTRIAQIDLAGVGESRRAALLSLLPFRALDPYRESANEQARRMLEQHYFEQGYLRATVAAAEVLLDSPASDGSPQVRLRFVIAEGPLCQLASLRFTGKLPLPEAELRRHVKSLLGQPPSFAVLRQDIQRLRDAAQAAGKSVEITPITSLRNESALLDVTLQFDPANQPSPGGAALK